jgi:hypothetical protein
LAQGCLWFRARLYCNEGGEQPFDIDPPGNRDTVAVKLYRSVL